MLPRRSCRRFRLSSFRTLGIVAQGRYVRVQLSNAGYLSLAEVQVFGQ